MNNSLDFLIMLALVFTLFIVCVALDNKNNDIVEEKKKSKKSTKTDELINTLDWMLANQIIDTREYNKLMVKCLPFLE